MNALVTAVRSTLVRLFDGGVPCSQNQATATAVVLARSLVPTSAINPVLYGNLKRDEARALVESAGVEFVPGEFMLDFVIMDCLTETKQVPLVACESEMYAFHGTGYGFTGDHGYVRDFRKLLFFKSPTLLFAAWVPGSRLDDVQESLALCAREYADLWEGDRLYVALFPSSYYGCDEVRLGMGEGGDLRFSRLADLN
jgi:hypothetical protein